MNRIGIETTWKTSWIATAAVLLTSASGCKNQNQSLEVQILKADSVSAYDSKNQSAVDVSNTEKFDGPSVVSKLPPSVIVKDVGFVAPGAAVIDEARDVYLISNAGPNPLELNNKGFISKISPDGKVIDLKWIEGDAKGATLVSPKGMAVRGNTLYVADIDTVRKFDVVSGKSKGDIRFEHATYLNDIVLAANGTLYVTDTGLTRKPKIGMLVPSETDCIYGIDRNDHVTRFFESKDLKQPNGIITTSEGFYIASYSTPQLLLISRTGTVENTVDLPGDRLDGVVQLPDGKLLITSWRASAVFEGMPEGPFTTLIDGLSGPGDLTYDAERNQLVLPAAKENALYLQPLGKFPTKKSVDAPAQS